MQTSISQILLRSPVSSDVEKLSKTSLTPVCSQTFIFLLLCPIECLLLCLANIAFLEQAF